MKKTAVILENNEKREFKLIIEGLENEKKALKGEVADLKLKKKIGEEEIKHVVKIDRERKDIEIEKEKLKYNSLTVIYVIQQTENYY